MDNDEITELLVEWNKEFVVQICNIKQVKTAGNGVNIGFTHH
jgi:hypothetical protein